MLDYRNPKNVWHLSEARMPNDVHGKMPTLCGFQMSRLNWMPGVESSWEYLTVKQPGRICYECVEALMT